MFSAFTLALLPLMALAAEQIIYYKMALISVEPVSNYNEVGDSP